MIYPFPYSTISHKYLRLCKLGAIVFVCYKVFLKFMIRNDRALFERERVLVLLGNDVQSSEVNAKAKGTILLVDEEDQSSMGRTRWVDETCVQILVNEFA